MIQSLTELSARLNTLKFQSPMKEFLCFLLSTFFPFSNFRYFYFIKFYSFLARFIFNKFLQYFLKSTFSDFSLFLRLVELVINFKNLLGLKGLTFHNFYLSFVSKMRKKIFFKFLLKGQIYWGLKKSFFKVAMENMTAILKFNIK